MSTIKYTKEDITKLENELEMDTWEGVLQEMERIEKDIKGSE